MKSIKLMKPGESMSIILPSGREINVEVTADTTSIVHEDRVLFNEELDFTDNRWDITWPKLEAK